jgi:hypothetical protein
MRAFLFSVSTPAKRRNSGRFLENKTNCTAKPKSTTWPKRGNAQRITGRKVVKIKLRNVGTTSTREVRRPRLCRYICGVQSVLLAFHKILQPLGRENTLFRELEDYVHLRKKPDHSIAKSSRLRETPRATDTLMQVGQSSI